MFNCELPLDWTSSKRPASTISNGVDSKHTIVLDSVDASKVFQEMYAKESDGEGEDVPRVESVAHKAAGDGKVTNCKKRNGAKRKQTPMPDQEQSKKQQCNIPSGMSRRRSHLSTVDVVPVVSRISKQKEKQAALSKESDSWEACLSSRVNIHQTKKDADKGVSTDLNDCESALYESSSMFLPGLKDMEKGNSEFLVLNHPLGNKTQWIDPLLLSRKRQLSDVLVSEEDTFREEENHVDQPSDFTNQFSVDPASCRINPPNMGDIKKLIINNLQSALKALTTNDSSENDLRKNNEECAFHSTSVDREISNIEPTDKDQISNQNYCLDTDNLISRLPYKKMLADMFGNNLRGHLNNSNIPYVTRVYEESFMREPMNSGERLCAKGKMCECMFLDKQQPFIGVEFLLPGEQPPRTPNMCVLCYRSTTQQLYYDVIFDKCDFPGCIQKFGNIHSEAGEYSLDAMLIAAPTAPIHIMPLPIVSHQRNRYVIYVASGIKRLKQSKVYFRNTPSYSQEIGPSCQ